MKSGFTLIELLVVIGIIGLITTVSTVSFTSAKEKARIASGQTVSKSINDAVGDEVIGNWGFDECSGTTVADNSGANRNSAIIGTASWSTDTRTGTGCSLQFDGSTYIDGNPWTIQQNNFTITAWFKTKNANEQIMVTVGNEDILETHNGRMHFDLYGGSSGLGAKKVNDNKWHFAVVVGDNTSMRVYLDGSNKPDLQFTAQTDSFSDEILIGRCAAGYNFIGLLDDVHVYQKALTAREINHLYAQGISRIALE